MPRNNNESVNLTTKLFPVIIGIFACAFLYIVSYYRNKCVLIASLGNFTLTLSLFLVWITIIDLLNRLQLWEKYKVSIKGFFSSLLAWISAKLNLKKANAQDGGFPPANKEAETVKITPEQQSDLVDIKKETVLQQTQESVSVETRIYQVLYIIGFLGLAFWRIRGMFKLVPLSYIDDYRCSIVDAVLLLVFPCIAMVVLKMKKAASASGTTATDAFFHSMLTFFSYTSLVYAAVIAAVAVLNIPILVILKWVYYAVSAYVVLSLAFNIALSLLKGDILSFNYTLFPKNLFFRDATAGAEDDHTSNWKVSLKSLYTIRYTLRILPGLVICLIFMLFISTAFFVVQPHQQAAVYHFGKLPPNSIKDAGLHVKFPWPIDKTEIYDVSRVASMQIGYVSSGTADFLWTQKHDGGEYMLLLGNGNEMAAVNLKVLYVISDLYSYIKTCSKAEDVLAAAAYNALMTRTINTTLDVFLNVDRNSLSESVLDELSAFCTAEQLGLSVVQIIVENLHPPVDIAGVYQNVVSASVDKTTAITRAHAYAQTKIIGAAKQSKAAMDQAMATRHHRTSEAQKETAIFYGAADAYRISPVSYELAKNMDVYEKIINAHKVYVFTRGTENNLSRFIIGKVNTLNLADANKGEGQ